MVIANSVCWRNQRMIKMYTTHCPKCKVLYMKMMNKNIQFTEVEDVEEMKRLGLKSAPALNIDGKILTFEEALKWVKEQ